MHSLVGRGSGVPCRLLAHPPRAVDANGLHTSTIQWVSPADALPPRRYHACSSYQLENERRCSSGGCTILEISGLGRMTADEQANGDRRLDDARRTRIMQALDNKTKPQGSLGQLERLALRIAMVQRTEQPCINRARVLIFAGDHGVAANGVSAYPASVTAAMVRTAAAGGAAVSVLTRAVAGAWADIEIIDVGVGSALPALPGVISERVANGTRDFLHEPAMTAEDTIAPDAKMRADVSWASPSSPSPRSDAADRP